ncbi:MAG: helix-turn-helix domain-containing protein [Chlorobiaceae bacterium]
MKNTLFTPPEKKYLSVDGARQYADDFASFSLSKSRFYTLIGEGKIPHIKGPGGRLLIPIAEFRAWLVGNDANGEA